MVAFAVLCTFITTASLIFTAGHILWIDKAER